MRSKLGLLFGCFLLSGVQAMAEDKTPLKEFAEKDFTVLLPGEPQKKEGSTRAFHTTSYTVTADGLTYVIGRQNCYVARGRPVEEILDMCCHASLNSVEVTAQTTAKIKLQDKYSGREMRCTQPGKESLRVRVYMVSEQWSIFVMVKGETTLVDGKDATTFLDSFKIVEKK